MSPGRSLGRHSAVTGLLLLVVGAGALAAIHPLGAAPPAASDPVPSPDGDAFYWAPSPLPEGAPGTVIRSRPVTVHADPAGLAAVPVNAWQVLYLSTSAEGRPVAVSGTVLVPRGSWGGGARPLVTYAIATHGLGDQCAPSYLLRTGDENERGLMDQALAQGWAVVVTDYEALGTPRTHTYAVGLSEGHAVLDAARAAQGLAEAGLEPGGPLAIWGYSQGGQAAASAGEQAPTYAPELRIMAVAAGGVPADLVAVSRNLDGGPAAGLALAGAVGFGAAYPDLDLESILNEEGRAAARHVAESCLTEIVTSHSFRRTSDYTTVPDVIDLPRWRERLFENRLGRRAPPVPALLYHGTADELIPMAVGEQLAADYRSFGVLVEWRALPLLGHVPAAIAGAPIVVSWLGQRFAAPAASAAPPNG